MNVRYAEAIEMCGHLRELVGARIDEFMRVVVVVEGERIELLDTLLVNVNGSGGSQMLQIFADGHRQWSKWILGGDYRIEGEWEDRESQQLQVVGAALVPFVSERVYAVWDSDTDSEKDYLIGFLLADNEQARLAINVHLDDIEVTSAAAFWGYLTMIIPQTHKVEICLL